MRRVIDWKSADWRKPDCINAVTLGCHAMTVTSYRSRNGIPTVKQNAALIEQRKTWDWSLSDHRLSKIHGVHHHVISRTRSHLGISKYQRKYRDRVPFSGRVVIQSSPPDQPLPSGSKLIPLVRGRKAATTGYFASVDAEDFARASQFKWRTNTSKRIWYVYRYTGKDPTGKSTFEYLHHFITQKPTSVVVDHRDGNGLNNCRLNLRPCTDANNASNRILHSNNTTGYKGVSWHRRDEIFNAKICVAGKQMSLGKFTDPTLAALAYDSAAVRYFGEFAKLNFPQNGKAA